MKMVRESEYKIWSIGRPVKLGLYFVVSRLPTGRARRKSAIIPEPAARHYIDYRSSFGILIMYVICLSDTIWGCILG
ncbi:hypothetical protein Scep_004429 [Stephania cephalantha]|uniref:Uncharacterized protein n=1 Tax=Stephania cephalantha TaxID=152367 RepID=A0AAP0PWN2_9MAGN